MAKPQIRSSAETVVSAIFFIFVTLALLSPLWVFKDLLFPFITSKAFTFRAFVELALPFYVYLLIRRKDCRPSWKNPLVLAMLAFWLIGFITAFTGVNQNRSLWGNFERMGGAYYVAHLTLLAMYVVMLAQIGSRYIKNILYAALGVAVLITLNGISGWLGGPVAVPDPSLPSRVSSTLGNPIFLGSFLILPMFLAAFFALQEEDSLAKKLTLWGVAALLFVGIILSVTRGALVGLIAGCAFAAAAFIVFYPRPKVRVYGGAVLIAAMAIVVSFFIFNQKLPQNRITRLFQLQGSDTQARFLQWRTALRGFVDRPVLGVGLENYYFISNKYYNPEMVKYDASWFDKPHNYILEVLVTTGVFGFAAYMAMILLVLWATYKAWRAELISLLQMCLLLAGFASYFVQNLFVFDTIPASMMFYVFAGFAAFLLNESGPGRQKPPAGNSANLPALAGASLAVAAVVAVYAVYVTNILPAQAAKNVNYGYAYVGVDINKAYGYFQDAVNSPFNFDAQDTAQRFSEMAATAAQSSQLDPAAAKQMVAYITDYEKRTAQSIGNDPVSWQKLANDYYIQAVVNKTALDPSAEQAVKRAVSLAPDRIEPELLLAQIYVAENRLNEAQTELTRLNSVVPLTSYTVSSRWLLAYVDHLVGDDSGGAAVVKDFVAEQYSPQNLQTAAWLLDYFNKQGDYQSLVLWSQWFVKNFPQEPGPYLALAQGYAHTGQIPQAKDLLQKLIDQGAPNKDQAQALLKTLSAQ